MAHNKKQGGGDTMATDRREAMAVLESVLDVV